MKKLVAASALVLLAAASAGASVSRMEPAAPQAIADARAAGGGTVVGTVTGVADHALTLSDDTGELRVGTEHLALANLRQGEQLTVTGKIEGGQMEAQQAVREDGALAERRGGDDDEHHEGGRNERHDRDED